ncbi:MAG: plasmid replication/partition related protein [Leptothrix sp. (in: b-proteobacteria)]
MHIVVREDIKAYIDPLSAEEFDALERSLLADGCRDALVLWGDVLVDGHNRHAICERHGLPYQTVQHPRLHSIEEVQLWMIDQHLGRRSVSDFQRGVLALRKRDLVATQRAQVLAAPRDATPDDAAPWDAEGAAAFDARPDPSTDAAPADADLARAQRLAAAEPLNSREALAKAARLSSAQVAMIEKIQQQAAPELVAAVRAGEVSISAAAAVASLPADEQAAAAVAGKDGLKQAARRVREAKRQARDESAPKPAASTEVGDAADRGVELAAALEGLRRAQVRIAELNAEVDALRRQLGETQAALQAASQA